MDAKLYREILGDYLFPFMAAKFNFDCVLHQDNDPKHTSRLIRTFLDVNEINWVSFILFKKNKTLFDTEG